MIKQAEVIYVSVYSVELATNKRKALAKLVGESACSKIKDNDFYDEVGFSFTYGSRDFFVLNYDESIERLEKELSLELDSFFAEIKYDDLLRCFGITRHDIQLFFLADVLTHHVTLREDDDTINAQLLSAYLHSTYGVEYVNVFSEKYAEFLMKENRGGEFLCYKKRNTIIDGFYIYFRESSSFDLSKDW